MYFGSCCLFTSVDSASEMARLHVTGSARRDSGSFAGSFSDLIEESQNRWGIFFGLDTSFCSFTLDLTEVIVFFWVAVDYIDSFFSIIVLFLFFLPAEF